MEFCWQKVAQELDSMEKIWRKSLFFESLRIKVLVFWKVQRVSNRKKKHQKCNQTLRIMGILRHKRQTSWFEVDQVALAGSVQEILQDFSKTIRKTLDLLPTQDASGQ